MTTTTRIFYAGNIVTIDRTFTRASAGTVTGTTANVAVTDPAGATTGLAETITTDDVAGTVRVQATYNIPDNAAGGAYTVTFDLAAAMVAAFEEKFYVRARTAAVVP